MEWILIMLAEFPEDVLGRGWLNGQSLKFVPMTVWSLRALPHIPSAADVGFTYFCL